MSSMKDITSSELSTNSSMSNFGRKKTRKGQRKLPTWMLTDVTRTKLPTEGNPPMVTPSGNEPEMTIESTDCTEATTTNTQMNITPTNRPKPDPPESTSLPEDQIRTENSTSQQANITPGFSATFSSVPLDLIYAPH